MAKTNIIALLLILAIWTLSPNSQRSENSISEVEITVDSANELVRTRLLFT